MKQMRREVPLAALIPYSEALRLDAELVRLARGASALRLAVGEALDVLSSTGGHHELGFSSLEAYARERCARTGRWAADTRALARRLQFLPRLREELRSGTVGWSTAELLARHVTVDSELEWLERARRTTVRELRTLLASGEVEEQDEDEPTCKLTATATREDGWMLECARKVAESVVGPMSADRLLQCLLAEGYSTLLELVPDAAGSGLYDIDAEELDIVSHARMQAAWCAERKRWQREAEELCESRGLPPVFDPRAACLAMAVACSSSEVPEDLDSKIRNWCSERWESSRRARVRPKSGDGSVLRPNLNMCASASACRSLHSSRSGSWRRGRYVFPSLQVP
jgi:hypothetical protein